MEKIIFKEAVISTVAKNTFREITVKFKLHPSDYTPELEEQLYSLRENSEALVVVIQPSGYTPPPETEGSRLAHLHKCMMYYSDRTGTDIETLKADLYRRHSVLSRKELLKEEIEAEIKLFTSPV